MSGAEKVDAFNPILILVYALELILLGIDYTQDGVVTWSIPIIGSVFIVQIYMIWKTNYDEMMEERRQAMGGPVVPEFDPSSDDLGEYYKSQEAKQTKKQPSSQMINLNMTSNQKQNTNNDNQ